MKLTIPFVYEVIYIKPRCRNQSKTYVKDTYEFTIAEATDMPLAATIGKDKLYFYNGTFYERSSNRKDEPQSRATFADMYKGGMHSPKDFSYSARDAVSELDATPTLDELKARSIIHHERESVIDAIQNKLNNYIVKDDAVYTRSEEHVYYTQTFGLGRNHGGTALFLGSIGESKRCSRATATFSLNNLEEAITYATDRATVRGDTKNLPIQPHDTATVHMPEAFTWTPYTLKNVQEGRVSIEEYLEHHVKEFGALDDVILKVSLDMAHDVNRLGVKAQADFIKRNGLDLSNIAEQLGINP